MMGRDFSRSGEPEGRIQEELPNVRTALEWALDRGDPSLALEFAATAG